MSRPEPRIQEPIYDQLWIFTNLTARPFFGKLSKKYRMNLTEWRILRIVARNPGVTAQEVTVYAGLDKMSVSRAVRALESNGHLARDAGGGGRSLPLRTTTKGQKTYHEIIVFARNRDLEIYGQLTATETVAFDTIMHKLLERARLLADSEGA